MRPLRPTIVSLMIVIAACGLLMAWGRYVLMVPMMLAHQSVAGWAVCLVLGYGLSQAVGWKVPAGRGKIGLRIVLGMTLVVTAYLAWAFDRCDGFASLLQQRSFPFPDPLINGAAHWFDLRYPVPPGSRSYKVHGEYPRVALILGIAVLLGMGSIGVMLGAFPARVPSRAGAGGPRVSEPVRSSRSDA